MSKINDLNLSDITHLTDVSIGYVVMMAAFGKPIDFNAYCREINLIEGFKTNAVWQNGKLYSLNELLYYMENGADVLNEFHFNESDLPDFDLIIQQLCDEFSLSVDQLCNKLINVRTKTGKVENKLQAVIDQLKLAAGCDEIRIFGEDQKQICRAVPAETFKSKHLKIDIQNNQLFLDGSVVNLDIIAYDVVCDKAQAINFIQKFYISETAITTSQKEQQLNDTFAMLDAAGVKVNRTYVRTMTNTERLGLSAQAVEGLLPKINQNLGKKRGRPKKIQ